MTFIHLPWPLLDPISRTEIIFNKLIGSCFHSLPPSSIISLQNKFSKIFKSKSYIFTIYLSNNILMTYENHVTPPHTHTTLIHTYIDVCVIHPWLTLHHHIDIALDAVWIN